MNIKKDDKVIVLSGKDKGKQGKVLIADPKAMKVGVKVTLRQDRMWEFLDRLFNVALPRVRDFRGISADAFDGRGNYSLGLKEQIIFPEIEYDKIEKLRGMNIAITTTAKTDEEARELLKLMGAPFVS